MEFKRELFLSVGALVVLNLLFTVGAIGLFVRMGPAIGRIIDENVYSILAAEDMLIELSLAGGRPLNAAARARYEQALRRAEQNVTETSEHPRLVDLREHGPRVVEKDGPDRHAAIEDLRELIAVNREAMENADEEAQRLGRAGAWSAVLVGLLSLAFSLAILGRLNRRLILPLAELHTVLERAEDGDRYRRCRITPGTPVEIRSALYLVNRLLDERKSNPGG